MDKQAIRTITQSPQSSGVYIFRHLDNTVLYVGKAKNLRNRLRSYLDKTSRLDRKTQELVAGVASVQTIQTVSEFDALILEAKLIRSYNPKYNIISRDDKSPLYIAITTSEKLPRILFVRKTSLPSLVNPKDLVFGPFQSSRMVHAIMRDIRRIIPFCREKNRNGKPCFYTHIGLCGPCPSYLTKATNDANFAKEIREYRANIRAIVNILDGRSFRLLTTLRNQMNRHAKSEQFEQADTVKKRIVNLQQLLSRHYDPFVYESRPDAASSIFEDELAALNTSLSAYLNTPKKLARIEAIDISHLSGQFAVGSLVVFVSGKPDKGSYRRFRIRTVMSQNDPAMIAEVVRRRLTHTDWPLPDLFLVDGGRAQVGAAATELSRANQTIPLAGLAKRMEELLVLDKHGKFKTLRLPLTNPGLHILMALRDEAHRFGKSYHRLLRQKAGLSTV